MNKKVFFAGVFAGIILTLIFLFALFWLDEKYHFVTDNDSKIEVLDSVSKLDTIIPVLNMPEEEFEQEMMKGVQGDFTLEQIDSMQKEWARLDSIESQKP